MVPTETRRRYAEEICTTAKASSGGLLEAFARVRREDFVGPSPWKVLSRAPLGQIVPQITEVSDPSELYRDVAVFLDASKSLTNGNPSTVAPWLHALGLVEGKSVFHLGCGTGYYTAILTEVVGPHGHVIAAEIDPALAARARANLACYPNVHLVQGDGGAVDTGGRDAILINAGVTHPAESWLDNMTIGGTLVLPITIEVGMPYIGKGLALHISRLASGYAAQFLPTPVMIYSCTSVRDAQVASALGKKLMSGTWDSVQSLRRDLHSSEQTCWLHSTTFCLSTLSVNS